MCHKCNCVESPHILSLNNTISFVWYYFSMKKKYKLVLIYSRSKWKRNYLETLKLGQKCDMMDSKPFWKFVRCSANCGNLNLLQLRIELFALDKNRLQRYGFFLHELFIPKIWTTVRFIYEMQLLFTLIVTTAFIKSH